MIPDGITPEVSYVKLDVPLFESKEAKKKRKVQESGEFLSADQLEYLEQKFALPKGMEEPTLNLSMYLLILCLMMIHSKMGFSASDSHTNWSNRTLSAH